MNKAKFYLIGFLVLLAFDTFSQVSIKFAATNTAPAVFDFAWLARISIEKWIYFAILSYIGGFITWMSLLKHAPVGPAFAASHLEIVTVTMVSVLWLGESLSPIQVAGSVLIVGGIFMFALAEAELERSDPAQAEPG